jgi:hypothetical protein
VVHAQGARAFVGVDRDVRARLRLHGGDQLDWRSHRVGEPQRAALVRHLDEPRRDAGAVEVRLRLVEILLVEHVHADAFAARHVGGPLQREAVMAAFLDAAQPQRIGILVADDQTDHLGIERLAGREILCGEHEVARARDVERRVIVGLRKGHRTILAG